MLFDQALDIPDSLKTDELKVTLMPESLRYSVRIKTSNLKAVKKLSGLNFPSKIGKTDRSKAQVILCLGPDEWLIIADPKEKTKLAKTFAKIEKDYVVSVTDISHRNIGFGITGPLAVGKTTRTVFESASIILIRTGENDFGIECWRSFAPYLCDFFVRIANDKRG